MFGTIRRHQSWLWAVIIAVMIISLLYWIDNKPNHASGRSGEALVLNGRVITPAVLREAMREVELLYFLNFRKWPDQDTERANQMGFDKENEAYLRLFRVAKAEEAGVKVADTVVRDLALRLLGNYPLAQFEKDVLNPVGLNANDFERFVRNDASIQQLSAVVGAAGRLVTPTEAEEAYRRNNQALSGDLVFIHTSNYLSKVTITNGALTNFFAQRAAFYRVPDKIRVSYVEFPKAGYLPEADKMMATVTNLESRLLEKYYKLGTNNFTDTNGVVLSEKAALAQIREDEREALAFNLASRRANEFANKLYDMQPLSAQNLDTLAAKENLKVAVSEPFDSEEGPTKLKVSPRFTKAAFSLNATNNPISFQPVDGENGIYVIALKDTVPGRPQTYAEVQAKVTEDYRRMNAFMLARTEGQDLVTRATTGLASGKTFTEIAQQMKLKVETLPPISQSTESVTNLEERLNVRQLRSVMFSLEPGKVSSYIPNGADGGYVVYVRGKLPFDEAKVKEELPKFTADLRYQKQNEIFAQWFRKQVEAAKLPLRERTRRTAS